jgi:hypothetical protein
MLPSNRDKCQEKNRVGIMSNVEKMMSKVCSVMWMLSRSMKVNKGSGIQGNTADMRETKCGMGCRR